MMDLDIDEAFLHKHSIRFSVGKNFIWFKSESLGLRIVRIKFVTLGFIQNKARVLFHKMIRLFHSVGNVPCSIWLHPARYQKFFKSFARHLFFLSDLP